MIEDINVSTVKDFLPYLPLSYDYAKRFGLVFSRELAIRLRMIQIKYPDTNKAKPFLLQDGRYLLCADILTEVPNGIFSKGFMYLDKNRFNEIDVIKWEEAKSMILKPELILD